MAPTRLDNRTGGVFRPYLWEREAMAADGSGLASQCRWRLRALGLLLIPLLSSPPSAEAETRGYVISMIHTATYANPDTCPAGGNGGPLQFRTRRLMDQGYSEEAALRVIENGGRDTDGTRVAAASLFGSTAAAGQQWNGQPISPGNIPADRRPFPDRSHRC